jgi:hypothetical protein
LADKHGVPLADAYLKFLGGRSRPNTAQAAAYDLRVFFSMVGKPPDQVRPADVLAFITAQRTGQISERGALQPVKAGTELPEDDARALLASALAGPLDSRVRDQIIAETRGNPLALLELPRGLSPAQLAAGFGLPDALPGAALLAGRI